MAGEDAVRAAGAKYLPRLDGQSDEDYLAYETRACFSNATCRAADAFVGLVFRKAPFVKIPESQDGIGEAMARFSNHADMLGTSSQQRWSKQRNGPNRKEMNRLQSEHGSPAQWATSVVPNPRQFV